MAKLDDTTTEELREQVTLAMVRMASQGSVPAATAVLRLLDEIEDQDVTSQHRAKLDRDPVEVAKYFGELGVGRSDVVARLGRAMSREEVNGWKDGDMNRNIEMRALELSRVRKGGKLVPWMTGQKKQS